MGWKHWEVNGLHLHCFSGPTYVVSALGVLSEIFSAFSYLLYVFSLGVSLLIKPCFLGVVACLLDICFMDIMCFLGVAAFQLDVLIGGVFISSWLTKASTAGMNAGTGGTYSSPKLCQLHMLWIPVHSLFLHCYDLLLYIDIQIYMHPHFWEQDWLHSSCFCPLIMHSITYMMPFVLSNSMVIWQCFIMTLVVIFYPSLTLLPEKAVLHWTSCTPVVFSIVSCYTKSLLIKAINS